MPDQNQQSLTDKISELESLISTTDEGEDVVPVLQDMAGTDQDVDDGIPILDELAYDGEDGNAWRLTELPSGTADQMLELIDNIEHRLTSELEDLVHTLKTTMKESIIEELKIRLEEKSHSTLEDSDHPAHKQ